MDSMNQAAPPAKRGGVPRLLIIGGAIVACIVLGCGGFLAFGLYIQNQEQKAFNEGYAAYQAGNCPDALAKWADLTGEDLEAQIAPLTDHCNLYQPALDAHQAGRYNEALSGYISTIALSNGLDAHVGPQLDSLFATAEPDQLVNEDVCAKVPNLSGFPSFTSLQDSRPGLTAACGDMYYDTADYSNAVQMYQMFLSDFPTHSQAASIEERYADASVQSARAQGAGTISAPPKVGETGTGDAVVIIQNDSPEGLRIIFSGPETHIEELPVCDDCQTYFGVGPAECPNLGAVGEYTLPPGTYEVLVESSSDGQTTPFTGTWELVAGDEYSSCFFIVESVGP